AAEFVQRNRVSRQIPHVNWIRTSRSIDRWAGSVDRELIRNRGARLTDQVLERKGWPAASREQIPVLRRGTISRIAIDADHQVSRERTGDGIGSEATVIGVAQIRRHGIG